MQKELESGYTIETSANNGAPLVRVYNEVGVMVGVNREAPDESTALIVGEAIAKAYADGIIDGKERFANILRAYLEKHSYSVQ